MSYSHDRKIASHFLNMLCLAYNAKERSTSGKIDLDRLEKEFSSLLGNKLIADYVPNARKHSYKKVIKSVARGIQWSK